MIAGERELLSPCPVDAKAGNHRDEPFFSASMLAGMALNGLPATARGIRRIADADGWPWEERSGRGGGRLYPLSALPLAAQRDWQERGKQAEAAEQTPVRPAHRPAGTGFFDRHPEIADAVTAILGERKVSSRNMMVLIRVTFPDVELPSLPTFKRLIARIEVRNRLLFTAMRDPDRFKSRYRPALGRADASVTYAHEVWEIDTTKADILCLGEDGKPTRKAILGIVDRWSRRARYQVVESESAQSVRRMMVDTIRAWGVMPARLKVDHGSGFMNSSLESALDILGIVLDPCLPGHPEDKPFVERLFGTFNRERASLLDGFIGHNVAQAQQLRAAAKKKTGRAEVVPKLTPADLQRVIDGWLDGEYHQRRHSKLGMSPMEKWQRSPVPATAAPPESVLKLALSAYVGTATPGKRGVRWKNGRYWHSALIALFDRRVTLRRDEDDLGALFIFDEDGNYHCTAINHERAGLSEQAWAMAARADMARFMEAQKAEQRQRRKIVTYEKARDMLTREEAESAGKIVHLPGRTVERQTAAMRSMAERPAEPEMDPATVAAMLAEPAKAPAAAQTLEQKVADADAIIMAATRGEVVDDEALRRARIIAQSPAYQHHKKWTAEWGGALTPQSVPSRNRA